MLPYPANVRPRIDASAAMAKEPTVEVAFTTLEGIWLINRGSTKVQLSAGELCGFNTGVYVEIPSGWDSKKTVARFLCLGVLITYKSNKVKMMMVLIRKMVVVIVYIYMHVY